MTMKRISRRQFLRTGLGAGAGLLAASSGIALAQDAATATPAPTATLVPFPAGGAGKFTVIQKTEYFSAVQDFVHDAIVDFADSKGVELDLSTANPELFGDFLGKMLAAVQAGSPPDLGYHALSVPQMYALDIVEDVSDVVEELISRYGAVVPANATFNANIDGKWWAVPFTSLSGAWFARRDLFEAHGIDMNTLDTWDQRREAALAVSDPANNVWGWGLTINRSGDGHGVIMGVIQAFGGSFTDETGLKVTFNSPETLAGVKWLEETYTSDTYAPMRPPGIESWTDSSNNEAYLAGTVAFTSNQPTVYGAAKRDGNPVFENTTVLHPPKTNDGRQLEAGQSTWLTIFKGAANIDLAKELIFALCDPANITPMGQLGGGQVFPAYESMWTDDIIEVDPNFQVFRDIMFNPEIYYGRSHPALPNALIDSIEAQGITSQMMANVTTGAMTAEEAVADAHAKIVQIFEEGGVPQS
ncbi:MAG: extracellular solute-binding protein [Chloroflexota bacterium]